MKTDSCASATDAPVALVTDAKSTVDSISEQLAQLRLVDMELSARQLLLNLFTYHPPTPGQASSYERINEAALRFAAIVMVHCPPSPDTTDAIRKIREARMTANAAIATDGGILPRLWLNNLEP